MATAGRRVSESESSEGSSSSDDSLLTDTSQLSLQPYMHEPSATSSTYRRKVDKSASQHTLWAWLSPTHSTTVTQSMVCDFPLCPHIVSDVS